MGKALQLQPADANGQALRDLVIDVLREELGHSIDVTTIRRERSKFATRATVEVLTVTLADGSELSLFLKHLGVEEADHPDKQVRGRELQVYRQLLRDRDLPVVRCYGSRWDERTKHGAAFLQYVGDWNLKYHHLEHWFSAAKRLAQLHLHFAGQIEKLSAGDFLLQLDAIYLCQWAARSLAVVAEQSAALAADLADVVGQYERVAEVIGRHPRTLVHNDLAPKNVLADRSTQPAAIYFVDWEMAGIGCGLLDLVHLKHGLDPIDDRKMVDAYFEVLAGTPLLPSDENERSGLLAACELHQTLYRLAHVPAWRVSIAIAAEWVAEARQWRARVDAAVSRRGAVVA